MHRDRTPKIRTNVPANHPTGPRTCLRLHRWFPVFALFLIRLLLLPSAAFPQQGQTRYVNNADPACQGHSPCYQTIQTAVDAAQAGDTIRIQAGSYQEQVNISGKNNVAGATEADRIIIEADPTAPLGTSSSRAPSRSARTAMPSGSSRASLSRSGASPSPEQGAKPSP